MKLLNVILSLFLVFAVEAALASPSSLTYQGRIIKSDGVALEYNNVSFIFQIVDPSGQCVLYQEQVSGVNLANSGGVFDVPIGTGVVSFPTSGSFYVLDAFNNATTSFNCGGGSSTYIPAAGDSRRLRVQFHDGSGWKLISPDSVVRSVPYAAYSLSSQKLGNNVASDFLLKAGLPTCVGGTFLSWNGVSLSCSAVTGAFGGTVTNVTSANSYISIVDGTGAPQISLNVGTTVNTVAAGNDSRLVNALQTGQAASGDLDGTYPAPQVVALQNRPVDIAAPVSGQILGWNGSKWTPTNLPAMNPGTLTALTGDVSASGVGSVASIVNSVGGSSATDLHSAEVAANAASSANNINTIIKRDVLGNFSAGSASLSSVILKDSGGRTAILQASSLTSSYVLNFPTSLGSANQVLTTDSSGNLSWTSLAANLPPSGTASGDLSGSYPSPTVSKINGVGLAFTSLNNGNFLKYNGASWINVAVSSADLSDSSSLIKSGQMPANCSAGQTLTFSSPTATWLCTNIVVTAANFGTQSANTFLSGPTTGNATPTFRTLASADLPSGVVTTGTYKSVTVDTYGRVTSGTNPTTASGFGITDAFVNGGNSFGGAATLGTNDSNNLGFKTNNLTRVTIDGSGNIGIGTNSPVAKLDVSGGIKIGTDVAICSASYQGVMRLNGTNIEYCNGTSWSSIGGGGGVPAGTVLAFSGSACPSGFAIANGSAISRTTYATLFSIIGTTYGAGNGSTTFTLPDLRGEFIRGLDNSRGVDSGRTLGSFQDHMFQNHSHSGVPQNSWDSFHGTGWTTSYTEVWGFGNTGGATGNQGSETRPRNIALNYCIAVIDGAGSGGGSSGSGTTNYIPQWVSSTVLGNSPVAVNGSNVGIGTASPTVSLDVNGGLRAGTSTAVTSCGLGQANGEGTQRYNYTTHKMEFCNGSTWTSVGGFTSLVFKTVNVTGSTQTCNTVCTNSGGYSCAMSVVEDESFSSTGVNALRTATYGCTVNMAPVGAGSHGTCICYLAQ